VDARIADTAPANNEPELTLDWVSIVLIPEDSVLQEHALSLPPYLSTGATGMDKSLEGLTIGGLARSSHVNVETIRYYQRRGLLAEPRRAYGRIRRYGTSDVRRLHFVRTAQALGFSLDEVSDLLRLEDGTHCTDARILAEEKLANVRMKLADLHRIEAALVALVQDCEASRGEVTCPLIESFHGGRIVRG
jgi:MerR family mercuric resistance operon transcriptional regulator